MQTSLHNGSKKLQRLLAGKRRTLGWKATEFMLSVRTAGIMLPLSEVKLPLETRGLRGYDLCKPGGHLGNVGLLEISMGGTR